MWNIVNGLHYFVCGVIFQNQGEDDALHFLLDYVCKLVQAEEAKLITQLVEMDAINHGLFEQAYNASVDVSKFLYQYEMSKLLRGQFDMEGACLTIKAGPRGIYSEVWEPCSDFRFKQEKSNDNGVLEWEFGAFAMAWNFLSTPITLHKLIPLTEWLNLCILHLMLDLSFLWFCKLVLILGTRLSFNSKFKT